MNSKQNGILAGFRFEYDRCQGFNERTELTASWVRWLNHPYTVWTLAEVEHAKKVLRRLLRLRVDNFY